MKELNKNSEEYLTKEFDDYLDKTNAKLFDMFPSYILKTCDYDRYKTMFWSWLFDAHRPNNHFKSKEEQ